MQEVASHETLAKTLFAALCVSFLALPAMSAAATVTKPQTMETQQARPTKTIKKVAVHKHANQTMAKKHGKVAKAVRKAGNHPRNQ